MAKKKKTTKEKKNTNKTLVVKKDYTKGIILMILCTLFTSTGQIFLKKGMTAFQLSIIGLITNYSLILGAIFYLSGLVLLMGALKRLDLSMAYPFISLSFVWVALLSYFFLSETLVFLQWLGIAVILVGVTFIGLGEKK